MTKVSVHIVPAQDAGQRLDNYLMKCLKGVPKSRLYRAIRSGEIRINGGRCQPRQRVVAEDKLRLPPLRQAEANAPQPMNKARQTALLAAILYEDEDVLVINKPAGMGAQGGSGIQYAVIDQIRAAKPEYAHCSLVHRLDLPTSGCLVLAKHRESLTRLQAAWQKGLVNKEYWLLVKGVWQGGAQTVNVPLLRQDGDNRHKVIADQRGKSACTIFEPVAFGESSTVLKALPKTGRLHQIRVHAAYLDYPIVGDDKYGDFPFNRQMAKLGLDRLCLHARALQFPQPLQGHEVRIEAPLDLWQEIKHNYTTEMP